MESYEALSNAINRKTAEHAKGLGLSISTVSKWQLPSVDFTDSGAFNPLDRIESIIEKSLRLGNPAELALSPVFYLGDKFNFVPLILPPTSPNLAEITTQLHRIVSEFGLLINESSEALKDGIVTPAERKRIELDAQRLLASTGLFLKLVQEAAK